jgi:hypothetical protein
VNGYSQNQYLKNQYYANTHLLNINFLNIIPPNFNLISIEESQYLETGELNIEDLDAYYSDN